MESVELSKQLERAQKAVADGEIDVRCQRNFIFRLERAGKDTSEAHALLQTLTRRQVERLENLGHVIRQFPAEDAS